MMMISVICRLIMRGNSLMVAPEYVSLVVVRTISFTSPNHKVSCISDLGKGRNIGPEAWGWRDYNRWLPQDSVLNGNWYTGAKNHALSRMEDEQKMRFSFLFAFQHDCEVIDVIVQNQFKTKLIGQCITDMHVCFK